MPYIDTFRTLRVGPGISISRVAKAAGISRDTIQRIEKHLNAREETLVSAVHALNTLHYKANGGLLDPASLITSTSKYGAA